MRETAPSEWRSQSRLGGWIVKVMRSHGVGEANGMVYYGFPMVLLLLINFQPLLAQLEDVVAYRGAGQDLANGWEDARVQALESISLQDDLQKFGHGADEELHKRFSRQATCTSRRRQGKPSKELHSVGKFSWQA